MFLLCGKSLKVLVKSRFFPIINDLAVGAELQNTFFFFMFCFKRGGCITVHSELMIVMFSVIRHFFNMLLLSNVSAHFETKLGVAYLADILIGGLGTC